MVTDKDQDDDNLAVPYELRSQGVVIMAITVGNNHNTVQDIVGRSRGDERAFLQTVDKLANSRHFAGEVYKASVKTGT